MHSALYKNTTLSGKMYPALGKRSTFCLSCQPNRCPPNQYTYTAKLCGQFNESYQAYGMLYNLISLTDERTKDVSLHKITDLLRL